MEKRQVTHTGHAQFVTVSVIPGVLSSVGFLEIFFLLGTIVGSVSLEEEECPALEDDLQDLGGRTSNSMVSWTLAGMVKLDLFLGCPHFPPPPRVSRTPV